MSDPRGRVVSTRKEGIRMHKATLTLISPLTGESVRVIEDDNASIFYARIVGTIQGAISAGCTITNLDIVEV